MIIMEGSVIYAGNRMVCADCLYPLSDSAEACPECVYCPYCSVVLDRGRCPICGETPAPDNGAADYYPPLAPELTVTGQGVSA